MSHSQLILKRKLAMLSSTSGPPLKLASSSSSNPNFGADADATESESGDEESVDSDNHAEATALTSYLTTATTSSGLSTIENDEDDDGTTTGVTFQCRSCHATILNSQSVSDAAQKHLCWRSSSSVESDNSRNGNSTLTPIDIDSASFQPTVVIEKITPPKNSNKVTTTTSTAAALPATDNRRSSLNRAKAKLKESTIALLSASDDDDTWDDNDVKEDFVPSSKKRSKNKKSKSRSKSRTGAVNNRKSTTTHLCSFCPGRFHMKKVLEKHLATIHCEGAKNILTCPICHRLMNKRLAFQSHLSRHVNAEDVEIAFHLWSRWPDPKNGRKLLLFSCKFCLAPLFSHPQFMDHMSECHPEMGQFQSYGCDYCEKEEKEIEKFDTMRKLLAHIRSEHVDEYQGQMKLPRDPEDILVDASRPEGRPRPKSKCKFCNRFIDRWYMPAHVLRKHSNNDGTGQGVNELGSGSRGLNSNLFECPVKDCGAKLKNAGFLKMHFVLHMENNPYVCPVPGCVVKCDALCHLDRHLKLHRGKSHPCPKCGVSYSRIDKLRDHQKQCEVEQGNAQAQQDKKIWIDEHGAKRPVNSFHRLRRLTEEDEKVIAEHRKNIKARGSINQMISTDPVFIQVCKENPDFKEVILGKCKGSLSKERKRSEAEIKASTCTQCGKVLINSTSMRRHWKLIHNVILDEVKIETKPKSKSTGGRGGGRKKKQNQNLKKDRTRTKPNQNQNVVKIKVEKELNIPMEDESEFYFGDYSGDLKPDLDETEMKPLKLELLEELDPLPLPLPEVAVKKEEIDSDYKFN